MALKYATVGSVLMAIFIFIITGIFSWFGQTTLADHDSNTKTVAVLERLNKNIMQLNKTIEKINDKIVTNKVEIVKNSLRIRNLHEDFERYLGHK